MRLNARTLALLLACLALVVGAAACGDAKKQAQKDFDGNDDVDEANVKKGVKPEPDAQAAVIDTEFGRIVIELYPNVAPKMVERFKQLAGQGFYDGTAIHRVDPNLGIIQGGDPNSKDNDPGNDGAGSSPLPNLPAEFSDIPYERGMVGAARAASNDSANCQFFVTLKRQPAFDKRYTVFGRVIDGLDNADVIMTAPVAPETDRPAERVVVKSITLVPRANFK